MMPFDSSLLLSLLFSKRTVHYLIKIEMENRKWKKVIKEDICRQCRNISHPGWCWCRRHLTVSESCSHLHLCQILWGRSSVREFWTLGCSRDLQILYRLVKEQEWFAESGPLETLIPYWKQAQEASDLNTSESHELECLEEILGQ